MDWEWYRDSHTKSVFLHLILTANFEDSRYQGHDIPRGSVVTGYSALAATLGMTVQNVRTAFDHLKSTGEITVKVTSKFSVVTLVKYEDYQMKDDEVTSTSTSEVTIIQQASNKQVTASKEYKNKEIKKEYILADVKKNWEEFVLGQVEGKEEGVTEYQNLYKYISKKKGDHLLKMRDLLGLEDYLALKKLCNETPVVKLSEIVDAMINNPGYFRGSKERVSFYLTAKSWIQKAKKDVK